MRLRIRLLITALATAGLVVSGPEDQVPAQRGFSADAVEFQAFRGKIEREMASYRRDIVALLAAQDYDELESRARVAREEKQRFANGIWKLHQFYTALPLAGTDPDSAWEARLAQVKKWKAARPSSTTAHIALAEVYTAYAWSVRGGTGEADGTSESDTLRRERLESALAVLEDARALGVHDPHYWRAAHAIAVGLHWPVANLDELYEHAAALEPHYWSNDIARVSVLLARKGGDPDTVEAFAAAAADAADEYAAEIYARAAWAVNQASGSLLEESRFDWERVQAGYRALLQRHPDSTDLLSQYCVLACRARDKAAARKCFVKLAGKADLRAFKSPREYMRHLRWANWN